MKRVTSIATACVAAVLLALGVSVGAQDFNTQERTFLTFSNAVELPGMTLPAGTYTFRLADTPGRNVVQVLSQDEKETHGQFLFVPAERRDVTGETVITFRETAENTTPAIQYWYYPGESIGKEFIYPKDQAMKIAARTGQNVRTEEGLMAANGTVVSSDSQGQTTEWQRDQAAGASGDANVQGTAGLSAESSGSQAAGTTGSSMPADAGRGNDRDRQDTALATEPAASDQAQASADASATQNRSETSAANSGAIATSGAATAERDSAAVGTSGVSADAAAQSSDASAGAAASASTAAQAESTQARAELPRTASPLALSGLLGLLSLAGAFGLRAFRG